MGTLMFLMAMVLPSLNMLMLVNAQCDFEQHVELGKQYYIYNEEYPENYKKGTNCRWTATSDPGTQIVLTCKNINIPNSEGCHYDKLSISLSGSTTFADAHNYCGKRELVLTSERNSMTIGLLSSHSSPFNQTGNFSCQIAATKRQVKCDCGWKQGMRIVGGQETGVNEYPFMSVLVDIELSSLFCGASIISERYALTAAHCLTHKLIKNIVLLVGDHNITTGADTTYSKLYVLNKFIIHPEYNNQTQKNDLALVKTKLVIEFSVYVGPVCLPFKYKDYDFESESVKALGWGYISASGPKSEVLQEVTLQVISDSYCANFFRSVDKQICAYGDGRDSCTTDSGGPLVWWESSMRRLQLVGVISFGSVCASKSPSVNVRVTSYLPWIVSSSPDANYCMQ